MRNLHRGDIYQVRLAPTVFYPSGVPGYVLIMKNDDGSIPCDTADVIFLSPVCNRGNTSLIHNYISPIIGEMKLSDITPRVIEKYYQRLLKTRAVPRQNFGREAKSTEIRLVSNSIVHEIHKLLRSCFTQAMKWELIERNPCTNATVPKKVSTPRDIWDAETLFKAIELCDDPLLRLAMNLSLTVPEEAAHNTAPSATEDDQKLVQKILSNPDLMTLLRTLVK